MCCSYATDHESQLKLTLQFDTELHTEKLIEDSSPARFLLLSIVCFD